MQVQNTQYTDLLIILWEVISTSRWALQTSINTILVETYWNIGKYIVEYEQNGEKRAEYGKALLKNISRDLSWKYGKWFSVQNIEFMRKFYVSFSQVDFGNPQSLIRKLSWTHIVRLLSIRDEHERGFYMVEIAENSWSVRELDRQINSSLYERLALSKDREWVLKLSQEWQIIENHMDILKDPYILEFLGLAEKTTYSESDLEMAIIDNLETFLLELGKWFTFVGRQKRFSAGSDHFYVDLVFYNRLLRCFVLIDLKIGKITHQDIGQMQMYVNYYDREIRQESENKTIGILLCKEKNDIIVEYTLPEWENLIFAKEYNLYLPKKEEFQRQLEHIITQK